jgi:hypothetical protein
VYWALSSGLLTNHSLSIDAVRITDYEPLYPLYLAFSRMLLGNHPLYVQLLQVVVSSIGAVLVRRVVSAMTDRPTAGVFAAGLYVLDPLLIKQAAEQTDLVLATVLTIALAWALVEAETSSQTMSAGVLLGALVLTRAMTSPLVVLIGLVVAARSGMRQALVVVATALLVLSPLPVRNYSVNGSLWPTRSGLNLFIGNSPYTSALLPRYDLDLLQQVAHDVVDRETFLSDDGLEDEGIADAILTRRAMAYMAERPLRTVQEKARNVAYYFWPPLVPLDLAGPETHLVVGGADSVTVRNSVPRRRSDVVAYTVWYSLLLAGALVGVVLRRGRLRRDGALWCIAATYVAVHAVYVPATRYRAPVCFVLFFFASVALDYALASALRSARIVLQTSGSSVSVRG